ncbi:oligoribonuclease [Aquella oligotrophica]|uniref:Oligoribonuclease n=1 Tax=Aquella oligotrophica TaxID=2067065 RepID=A0A2I7N5U8_9NEIS|nr:oligoribonuclease [Aquella oligotrophica]AUR51844.1 oligoribonuclease [Aquella oligotrophica]
MTVIKNEYNLVWLDMEMTGLDPANNVILEVAVVITDGQLNVLAESESYAIAQPEIELAKMDKWNVSTHTRSGLIERVKSAGIEIALAEKELLKLIKKYTYKNKSPLCGNTIYQDRKFIVKYMPELEAYLHYRNVDVSSIKELARRWYPEILEGFKKHNKHEALADIHESIEELRYYRQKIMLPSGGGNPA